MRWIFITLCCVVLGYAAIAQTIQSGGGSIAAGNTPISGCTAGQILFSDGSKAQCSGSTTNGAGQITLPDILGNVNSFLSLTRIYLGIDSGTVQRISGGSSVVFSWGAAGGVNSGSTFDTGISRISSDSIALGNGVQADKSANLYLQSDIPSPTTIASLQTCNVSIEGARGTVTNGTATSGSFMIAVTATGTTISPVFCNGTSWLYGG